MNILIFGAGAIGTIYGYVLSQAGHSVTHYVRENRQAQLAGGVTINLLDGRDEKNVHTVNDVYAIQTISAFQPKAQYDLILVSIKHGSLEPVFKTLKEAQVEGDILFFNGLWAELDVIDSYLPRERYVWGYPVAGGNLNYETATLEGALLDHIQIGEVTAHDGSRLKKIEDIFKAANLKLEVQANILHWVWVHMAINAGVISTCLKAGSADAFMDHTKALREGILTIREGLAIVKARGVDLKAFDKDTKMFYYPSWISSILLKYFFKRNTLSRKIMSLHNNMEDLYELCSDVHGTGRELGVTMPLLEKKSSLFLHGARR